MFVKQDAYTKRWHIYTAPHTPAIIDGKWVGYDDEMDAIDAAIDALPYGNHHRDRLEAEYADLLEKHTSGAA